MRKTLLTTVSAFSLIFATAVWAQSRGEGGGEGRGQMAPGGGPGGMSGSGAGQGGAKMRGAGDKMGGESGAGEHEMQRQGRDEKMGGDKTQNPAKTKGAGTEGREGGRAAGLSSEQNTRVRSGFHGASIREARGIDVAHVSVGASIPRTVVNYWEPVPAAIVEVVPAWRAFKVVRIGDEIVVIDPGTYEVVYVL